MPRYRRLHADPENDAVGGQNSEDDWSTHPANPRLPPPRHNLSRFLLGAGRVLKVIRTSLKIVNHESIGRNRCTFDVTFEDMTQKLVIELVDGLVLSSPCEKCSSEKKFYITYGGAGFAPPTPQFPIVLSASHELLTDLQVCISDKNGDTWKDIRTGIFNVKVQPPQMLPLFTMDEIDGFLKAGNELTLNLTFRFYSNHCDVLSFRNFENRTKANLSNKLSQIKKTKDHPNMIIVSKDGREFECHEEVLKERSSFFSDVSAISHHITNGFRQYDLDIPSKAIVFLLHFLYRSEIHVKILGEAITGNIDELEQLLLVARKFQVPDLLTFFDENLIKLCWEDNAPALLKLAKTYHLPTAVEEIMYTFDLHDEENGDYLLCSFGSIRLVESRNSTVVENSEGKQSCSKKAEEGACGVVEEQRVPLWKVVANDETAWGGSLRWD